MLETSVQISVVLRNIRTSKIFRPPSILEPETISESECSDMYARKAYIVHGKTMRIGLNQQIQFPEITHGRITYDKYNVYCTGAKITIDGEQHGRMLELRTVMITMSEVDVEISLSRIIDLQNNVELEKRCIESMKCLMGMDTYLILEKPNHCQLAKIRSLVVSQVQLTHKGRAENYLINEEHKIILRKLDKQRSEECDVFHNRLP